MSLRVWLPLTKDLRNQGLDDVTVTNNGATFNSAGKLGGCYSFNGSSQKIVNTLPSTVTSSVGSLSCWVKMNSLPGSSGFYNLMQLGNLGGYATCRLGLYMEYTNKINISIDGSSTGANVYTHSLVANQWYHICATHNGTIVKLYINGNEVLSKTVSKGSYTTAASYLYVGGTSSYYLNGYINDARYYDHALSPMEVKELSKGLVLHYPLSDNSIQAMNNCYSYPRFETTASNGGWSHWGGTGHIGTYGQSTDSNYIFRQGQTYTHWVANGTGATYNYLLYQSPAFEGGTRSLQCICKEENGVQITNDICYATWNARSGGTVNNSWTSIIPLGNGFYWCKCENIQQDGSNDLVGIYIRPGYKVYFSECYLENDTEICSNPFFQSNIIYDCSGYCYNSILNASTTVTSDTPKYNVSSFFGAYNTPNAIVTDAATLCPALSNCTIAWWQKSTTSNTLLFTGQTTSYYIAASNANNYYHGGAGSPTMYRDGVAGTYQNTTGVWHHYVLTGVNLSGWTALKLNSYSSGWPLNGYVSDLRIYATALSASDVKSLYQNCATIDPDGTIRGQIRS